MLQFSELYDAQSITQFLHNFVTYEPLPKLQLKLQIPSIICSPVTTLAQQKGDAFDLCVLYSSLLCGSGYDTYVCIGRVRGRVALGHRRLFTEKILNDQEDGIQHESFNNLGEEYNNQNEGKKSKYILKKRLTLKSEYDKLKSQKNKDTKEDDDNINQDKDVDDLSDVFIHSWILILPNARNTPLPLPNQTQTQVSNTFSIPSDQPFFIEVSTGEQKPISDPGYLAIDSVFNHKNYWVNMQENIPVAETSLDLNNLDYWEQIFVEDKNDDDADSRNIQNQDDAIQSGEHDSQILDLPVSWIGRLSLSKELFFSKYPGKQKHIEYEDAIVQLYTPYSREDCLTKKVTLFKDPGKKKEILCEHFYFENREDMLIRRSNYSINEGLKKKGKRVTHEWFAPGRRRGSFIEALQEIILVEGERNEYRFYWDARLDGLEKRIELIRKDSRKVILTYKGRSDFLSYRSAIYEIGSDTNVSLNDLDDEEISKMSERFERNANKIADEDVAKRIYFLKDGLIRLCYHYGSNKITHAVREYTKKGDMSIDIVDPFQSRPKLSDAIAEYKQLLEDEKSCKIHCRTANIEMRGILEQREKEEKNVKYVTTIYDTLLNQPTAEEIEEMRRKEQERLELMKKKDVLGALYPKEGIHTEDQARELFKKCLRNMRKRLLERAKILEARLAHERNQVNRRRTAYQKTQEGSERNEEEFVKFWEDTMFRMGIIRKRVERNKIESKREYAQLQEELLNDERLAPFLQKERKKFYSQKETFDLEMNSSTRLGVSTKRS